MLARGVSDGMGRCREAVQGVDVDGAAEAALAHAKAVVTDEPHRAEVVDRQRPLQIRVGVSQMVWPDRLIPALFTSTSTARFGAAHSCSKSSRYAIA